MRHCINDKQNLGAHEAHVGFMQVATVTVFMTTFFLMIYTQKVFLLSKGHIFYMALLMSKGRGQIILQASLSRQPEDRKSSQKNTGYKNLPWLLTNFSKQFFSAEWSLLASPALWLEDWAQV